VRTPLRHKNFNVQRFLSWSCTAVVADVVVAPADPYPRPRGRA